MTFVVRTNVVLHVSAKEQIAAWAEANLGAWDEIRSALKQSKGQPLGAAHVNRRRRIWALGSTFVSYEIHDTSLFLPFLKRRRVVIFDIRQY